uniref:Piezo-type mechanosensitive ion channel component 2 n=1 Tax=Plectus sambesii TaxID=2011161 RepID=A0A914XG83_9BILA
MVSVLIKNLAYRVILPAGLLCAAIIRPSLVSLVYGVLALLCLLLPAITAVSGVRGSTRMYLLGALVYSGFAALLQVAYQIYAVSSQSMEQYTKNCNSTSEYWLRQVGFIRAHNDHPGQSARVILPEVIALAVSVVGYVLCVVLKHEPPSIGDAHAGDGHHEETSFGRGRQRSTTDQTRSSSAAIFPVLKRLSDILLVLLAAVVGGIQPSLLNSVYFIAFLVVATWWALYTPLHRHTYNVIKRLLTGYSALHLVAIYLYQINFIQSALSPKSLPARLVGLSAITSSQCETWWRLDFTQATPWNIFVNPALVLFFFVYVTVQFEATKHGVKRLPADREVGDDDGSSVHEERIPLAASKRSAAAAKKSPSEREAVRGRRGYARRHTAPVIRC